MSAEKVSEPIADVDCILAIGKNNNVVAWRENMQIEITKLYRVTPTIVISGFASHKITKLSINGISTIRLSVSCQPYLLVYFQFVCFLHFGQHWSRLESIKASHHTFKTALSWLLRDVRLFFLKELMRICKARLKWRQRLYTLLFCIR